MLTHLSVGVIVFVYDPQTFTIGIHVKVNLAHKIQKVGHSDLVSGVIVFGHISCLDTSNEPHITFHDL